jgi:hypothetical protein
MPESKTPELDKMLAAKKDLGIEDVGRFIEWLESQGIHLCEWIEHQHDETCYGDDGYLTCGFARGPRLDYISGSVEQLLAKYAGVDLDKVEAEKRQILEDLRKGAEG